MHPLPASSPRPGPRQHFFPVFYLLHVSAGQIAQQTLRWLQNSVNRTRVFTEGREEQKSKEGSPARRNVMWSVCLH